MKPIVLVVVAACGQTSATRKQAVTLAPIDTAGSVVPAFVAPDHQPELGAARDLACVTGLSGGATKCWGANIGHVFGDDHVLYRATATEVPSFANATSLSGGATEWELCAIFAGAVRCAKSDGTMYAVAGIDRAVQLSVNDQTGCAVLDSHRVACWGNNIAGALGDGTQTSRDNAVAVPGLDDVEEVRSGHGAVFARRKDGSVLWWGRNWHIQLDTRVTPTKDFPTPQAFPELGTVTSLGGISALGSLNCVLRTDQSVVCWGSGHSATPIEGVRASAIATGTLQACAIVEHGNIACWRAWARPSAVAGITGAKKLVAVGFDGMCAIVGSNDVRCWGSSPWTHGTGERFVRDRAVFNGPGATAVSPARVVGLDAPASCTKSCANRSCGDDGCGNDTCGQCQGACQAGKCEPIRRHY